MPWIATDCLVVIAKEVLRLLGIAGRLVFGGLSQGDFNWI